MENPPIIEPPIIKPPVKTTGRRIIVRILKILAATVGIFVFLAYLAMPRPPKESQLIKSFYTNRAAFEHLRDMLQADSQVIMLDHRGVITTNSAGFHIPPDGNFPVARYEEYLALLKQVGGLTARRTIDYRPNPNVNPSVLVWSWGWAGDSKDIGICWMNQAPTNETATLEGQHGRDQLGKKHIKYRHIDADWYLWTDL
jgi:hypothetical protein